MMWRCSCLTKSVGVWTSLVDVELPDTSTESTSECETTFVGEQGSSDVPVVGAQSDGLPIDAAALAAVSDGAADLAVEDEH